MRWGSKYFGRRFYAPMLQSWVSADPLAVHSAGEADLNLYAYVSGMALKAVDPLGLEGEIRVNVAPPGVKEGQRYIVVPAGQGGVAPTKKFKQAAKGQPVFIYDPVRGTDPETAITIWSAGQELGGKKGSALQDFLIGAALISGESTDAIKTDGTGSADGVPGGGCSVNCVSGKGVQGAYVVAAAAAVVSGARVGAKVVGKGAEKVGEAVASVGKRVTRAVKRAKNVGRKTHGHHSDPKFMGGKKRQALTDLPAETHKQLHKDMNDFLRQRQDAFGNHMRPQRGNSGARIRGNFTRKERLNALADFYRQTASKYPKAARDFFNQHPDL